MLLVIAMAVRNVWGAGTLLSLGEGDFEPIGNLKLQGIALSLFSSAMKLLIVWLYKSCYRVEKMSINEGGLALELSFRHSNVVHQESLGSIFSTLT